MTHGKRAGARATKPSRGVLLALALGVTLAVVAWGYLVLAAIDFGSRGREGDGAAWLFLALACVGAIACLFVGLVLAARIARRLGVTRAPNTTDPSTPPTPGGRRAAR